MKSEQNNRIGIRTIGRAFLLSNYGSFFQHYALRKVLTERGYVPYRLENDSWLKGLGDWLMPVRTLRMKIMSWLHIRHSDVRLLGLDYLFGYSRFLADYHRLIGRVFENQDLLKTVACVAGGDQIWSSMQPADFLLGMDSVPVRLSYAVSAGWCDRVGNEHWEHCLQEAGRVFCALGVRENAGVEICRRFAPQAEVARVADPVFLFSDKEWLSLLPARKALKRKTLLAYLVNVENRQQLNLDNLEKTAATLGCELKVIGVQGAQYFLPRSIRLSPGPVDFLSCYRDADYVITNSFHGLVFAAVLGKKLAFVEQHAASYGNQNARQIELLDRLGLQKRHLPMEASSAELARVLSADCDFDKLKFVIAQERDQSLAWLVSHLP